MMPIGPARETPRYQKLSERLLALVLPREHSESVLGDLAEEAEDVRRLHGEGAAVRRFIGQVLRTLAVAPLWHLQRKKIRRDSRTKGDARVLEQWTHGLARDLKYALRQLSTSRVFTVTSILVLALGIGANVTIFSLTNAVLLRPPAGVENPGELFQALSRPRPERSFELSLSYPDFLDLEEALADQVKLSAHEDTPLSVRYDSWSDRTRGGLVTANFFLTLGVQPHLGRLLDGTDSAPGASPVTVVSYEFWHSHMGGTQDAVGKSLSINGHSFTVIGVMSEAFRGISDFQNLDLWMPMAAQPIARPKSYELLTARGTTWVGVVGRLGPDVSYKAVAERIHQTGEALRREYPDTNKTREFGTMRGLGWGPTDRQAATMLTGTLLGVVTLVLLIACANVANLVLARSASRRAEVAVRKALGASHQRIVRLLLTESLVVSSLAAGLGLLFAWLGKDLLVNMLPTEAANSGIDLTLDHRVLVYTGLIASLSALTFGLAPAFTTSNVRLSRVLGGHGVSARGGRFGLRSGLVVLQLALSVVLLMASGLLLENMRRLQRVPTGFQSEPVLTTSVDPSLQNYTDEQTRDFYRLTTEKLEGLPGVNSVALAATIPLSGGEESFGGLTIEGHEPPDGRSGWTVQVNFVSPGFFETLEIPRLEGRDFNSTDRPSNVPVAIVNRAFRERFWPDGALGRSILFPRRTQTEPVQVVGIAADAHYRSLSREITPIIYLPLDQNMRPRMSVLLKGTGDPNQHARPLVDVMRQIDPDLPIFGVAPLQQIVQSSLWQERMTATLLTLFGGLALVLAAVGLYGVVAFMVGQRRQEIGIRMALGAGSSQVVREFMGGSFRLVSFALILGLLGSLATGRVLSNFLHGVRLLEPTVTFGVVGLLLAVTGVACLLPARAASRIDPVRALRTDS